MLITVDGTDVEVPDAMSILHALRAVGTDLPSLCDDTRLEPSVHRDRHEPVHRLLQVRSHL